MFEAAEIDHALSKPDYERAVPVLRERLLEAQYDLLERKSTALLILVNGVDGAGKGDTVNVLNEWLDPRHVRTRGFGDPSPAEAMRPEMWRFWRALPPRGHVGIFVGSWYSRHILDRAYGNTKDADLDQAMVRIRHLERMLTQDRVVLLKLWFHLSEAAQARRLKSLRRDRLTRWRVSERDLRHFKIYDRFREVSARALRQTSTEDAPWVIVPGEDARHRQLAVGNAVLHSLETALSRPKRAPKGALTKASPRRLDKRTVLGAIRMGGKMPEKRYDRSRELHQGRLNQLSRVKKFGKRSLIVVFEGWDAAGKGGAIRRLTAALDARNYYVVPVAAPSEEERAQPYLWRFWRQVPRLGQIAFFDRSWYGRVLVERVEGFASEADWSRAYTEINEFEEQLVEGGAVLVKFWLHIDAAEQLRRFRGREKTGFKRHKITPDDWRNREKRPLYERAVEDMIVRTSTEIAPWTLVGANDKWCARIEVLKTVCARLEAELGKRKRGKPKA